MKVTIVIIFGILIAVSYKPRKEVKVVDFKVDHIYKLTKVDAG